MVHEQTKDAPYFDTSSSRVGPPTAVGMGVAGGAYSGRVAINAQQIDRLVAEAPNDTIVLLRPDTVPEDIAMITRVEGLLTARGGATSHAAVTAKRLGKTAVVDCRELEVIEHQGTAKIGRFQAEGRRLAVHRRPDRQHLLGADPHARQADGRPVEHVPAVAAARPCRPPSRLLAHRSFSKYA